MIGALCSWTSCQLQRGSQHHQAAHSPQRQGKEQNSDQHSKAKTPFVVVCAHAATVRGRREFVWSSKLSSQRMPGDLRASGASLSASRSPSLVIFIHIFQVYSRWRKESLTERKAKRAVQAMLLPSSHRGGPLLLKTGARQSNGQMPPSEQISEALEE